METFFAMNPTVWEANLGTTIGLKKTAGKAPNKIGAFF